MCLRRCSVPPTSLLVKTQEQIQSTKKELLGAPKPNTDFVKKSLKFVGASLWNSLDNNARHEESLLGFKSSVQKQGF